MRTSRVARCCGPPWPSPFVSGVADGSVRVTGVAVDAQSELAVVVEHADESDAVLVLRDDRLELCRRADFPTAIKGRRSIR